VYRSLARDIRGEELREARRGGGSTVSTEVLVQK